MACAPPPPPPPPQFLFNEQHRTAIINMAALPFVWRETQRVERTGWTLRARVDGVHHLDPGAPYDTVGTCVLMGSWLGFAGDCSALPATLVPSRGRRLRVLFYNAASCSLTTPEEDFHGLWVKPPIDGLPIFRPKGTCRGSCCAPMPHAYHGLEEEDAASTRAPRDIEGLCVPNMTAFVQLVSPAHSRAPTTGRWPSLLTTPGRRARRAIHQAKIGTAIPMPIAACYQPRMVDIGGGKRCGLRGAASGSLCVLRFRQLKESGCFILSLRHRTCGGLLLLSMQKEKVEEDLKRPSASEWRAVPSLCLQRIPQCGRGEYMKEHRKYIKKMWRKAGSPHYILPSRMPVPLFIHIIFLRVARVPTYLVHPFLSILD